MGSLSSVCPAHSWTLLQAETQLAGNEIALFGETDVGFDDLTVRIGERPPVVIVLVEVDVAEAPLAMLNLRRANSSAVCRKAVDVTEEGMLAKLALRSGQPQKAVTQKAQDSTCGGRTSACGAS